MSHLHTTLMQQKPDLQIASPHFHVMFLPRSGALPSAVTQAIELQFLQAAVKQTAPQP
jgi:hypothetical protein